jgi:hypothetical protein
MLIKLVKFRKAQSTAEYAILFSLVVGAALAMQVYIKRSIQAKMHDAGVALTTVTGDLTGDGVVIGTTMQYEPYYKAQEFSEVERETEASTTTETFLGGHIEEASEQTADITSESTEQTHIDTVEE